jgi:hypothetical protein
MTPSISRPRTVAGIVTAIAAVLGYIIAAALVCPLASLR